MSWWSVVIVWVGLVARATGGIGGGDILPQWNVCHFSRISLMAVSFEKFVLRQFIAEKMMKILHVVEFSGNSEKIVLHCNRNHIIIYSRVRPSLYRYIEFATSGSQTLSL